MCDASNFSLGVVLAQQEFDIEIKDESGAENLIVDHLSRIERRKIDPQPIKDNLPDEQLVHLHDTVMAPWFANIVNYLVAGVFVPQASSL
uniref:Reverse transcriptase RNase H-like domain-containing protein n=1 Tax=Cajanus cajan TaxID=3821 RepID=A0A151QUE1_CAJCA|nr:hypothetical protein KK1_045197 [Cajanus cajan]KYP33903.1 hypothetical protein KK1_045198 [Cajanus cajan]